LYNGENKHTVAPYCSVGNTIEKANTLVDVDARFVFANPFGIRIQKDPFAIGYFNPWINEYVSSTHITKNTPSTTMDDNDEDISIIYHATPIVTNIVRTYRDNYYKLTTFISPTISEWSDGSPLVKYVEQNAVAPVFSYNMWNYFKEPLDLFASDIPLISLNADNGRIPFDPEKTYFCVKERKRDTREYHQDEWVLSNNFWIDDQTDP
jgi:hypothetical protein